MEPLKGHVCKKKKSTVSGARKKVSGSHEKVSGVHVIYFMISSGTIHVLTYIPLYSQISCYTYASSYL